MTTAAIASHRLPKPRDIDRQDAAALDDLLPKEWRYTGEQRQVPARVKAYKGKRRRTWWTRLRAAVAAQLREMAQERNEAIAGAWDDEENLHLVHDLHEPGSMPDPLPEKEDEPEQEQVPATAAEPEVVEGEVLPPAAEQPTTEPHGGISGGLTLWNREQVADLIAFTAWLDDNLTAAGKDLDDSITRWRRGDDLRTADLSVTAGAR